VITNIYYLIKSLTINEQKNVKNNSERFDGRKN